MKRTTRTTLTALLATSICGLAVLVSSSGTGPTAPAPSPVVAVELSTGQAICVYEAASVALDQKCDATLAKLQEASLEPGSLRDLVRAIKHAGEMSN